MRRFSLTAAAPRRLCFRHKNLLPDNIKTQLMRYYRCQEMSVVEYNEPNHSLRCHIASFTQPWDVNRIQWKQMLLSASQWVAMTTVLDKGKWGLMSWKKTALGIKRGCLPTVPLLETAVYRSLSTLQDDRDCKCNSIIYFPFVKARERELMNMKSYCIFRDNGHPCPWDVSGTGFLSSITLWTGGREPNTSTSHYQRFSN